ncbi:MAG: sortase [Chloroflexota bacterium]
MHRRFINRFFSGAGSVLVLTGVAVLVYVGVTYAQSTPRKTHVWNHLQAASGRSLASKLRHHQKVAVPKSLSASNPKPGSEPALRMVIPKINVDSRVVQSAPVGGVWNVADWAVGHLNSSPNPGAAGNGAYAAHDDIKGELFKRLGELQPGNKILVYSRHMLYRYVVTGQQAVDPSNVSVLAPTSQPTVTLITCAPYWVDTQRLIVQATLKSSSAI